MRLEAELVAEEEEESRSGSAPWTPMRMGAPTGACAGPGGAPLLPELVLELVVLEALVLELLLLDVLLLEALLLDLVPELLLELLLDDESLPRLGAPEPEEGGGEYPPPPS